MKSREEQQELDRRYADWRKVYVEEIHRAEFWGDSHKAGNTCSGSEEQEGVDNR